MFLCISGSWYTEFLRWWCSLVISGTHYTIILDFVDRRLSSSLAFFLLSSMTGWFKLSCHVSISKLGMSRSTHSCSLHAGDCLCYQIHASWLLRWIEHDKGLKYFFKKLNIFFSNSSLGTWNFNYSMLILCVFYLYQDSCLKWHSICKIVALILFHCFIYIMFALGW